MSGSILPLLAAPFAGWGVAAVIQYFAWSGQRRPSLAIVAAACGIAIWAVASVDTPLQVWLACLLGWTLLALGWIDALCFRLPDILTLPLLLAGLGIASLLTPDELLWHAVGAVCGYLALRGIAIAYRTLRDREGLGAGDAKLLAAAGAWLGIEALPSLVLIAACAALLWVAAASIAGRSLHATTVLPFGPFLAAAFWLLWLYPGLLGAG